MTSDPTATTIVEAFEQLCGEVSLLRRAIEGLAAERQAAPDYGPTLDAIDDRMTQFVSWARRVAETPLLKMTPATLEDEITRVASSARKADRETIQRADTSMAAAIQGVERVTASAWKASDQTRALLITGAVSALMAAILTLTMVRLFSDSPTTVPMSHAAPAHGVTAPAMPPQTALTVHHRHYGTALD